MSNLIILRSVNPQPPNGRAVQMSAKKVHFQIAECSPLYQKREDWWVFEKSNEQATL